MRVATQEDITAFYSSVLTDPTIYPYMQFGKYFTVPTIGTDLWHDIYLITDNRSCYLHIWIDRTKDNEFTIGLFAKNSYAAGKAVIAIKELIRRYRPRAINSAVHASNLKSLALNRKLFGEEGSIRVSAAWNMGTGEYEDMYQFRRILA